MSSVRPGLELHVENALSFMFVTRATLSGGMALFYDSHVVVFERKAEFLHAGLLNASPLHSTPHRAHCYRCTLSATWIEILANLGNHWIGTTMFWSVHSFKGFDVVLWCQILLTGGWSFLFLGACLCSRWCHGLQACRRLQVVRILSITLLLLEERDSLGTSFRKLKLVVGLATVLI